MAVLLDTSCLYALLDKDDRHHKDTIKFAETTNETLLIPEIILPEISYLVNKYLGVEVEVKLLSSIKEGELALETFLPADLERVIEVISTYKDKKIGFVDASIVAIAERLNITKIFTLDKHFRIIRPRHIATFEIYPSFEPT